MTHIIDSIKKLEKEWDDTFAGVATNEAAEAAAEALISRIDPKVFERPDFIGWLFRKIAAMDSTKRYGVFTGIGTAILASRLPGWVKLAFGRTFMAMAPGMDRLLKDNAVDVAEIERKLKEEYEARRAALDTEDDAKGEAWCLDMGGEEIHLAGVHKTPDEVKGGPKIVKGPLSKVRHHCARNHHHCNTCFPDLFISPLVTEAAVVEPAAAVAEEKAAEEKGGLAALAEFDPVHLLFILALKRVAGREVSGDVYCGLEGEAGALVSAIDLALSSKDKAKAAEAIIMKIWPAPENPPDLDFFLTITPAQALRRQNNGNPVRLPQKVQAFMEALFTEYNIAHPKSPTLVAFNDWKDKLSQYLPEFIRPKEGSLPGVGQLWAGFNNLPWYLWYPLAILGLCAIALLTGVALFLMGLAAFAIGVLVTAVCGFIGSLLTGLVLIWAMYAPHLTWWLNLILTDFALFWIFCAVLVVIENVTPQTIKYRRWIKDLKSKEEIAKIELSTEPARSAFLTLRVGVLVASIIVTLLGWAMGAIDSVLVAVSIAMILFALAVADMSLKWSRTLSPETRKNGIRAVVGAFALGLVATVITFAFLVLLPGTVSRVVTLAGGSTDRLFEEAGERVGVPVTPRLEVCFQDRAEKVTGLEIEHNLPIGSTCADESNAAQWPCDCQAIPWPGSAERIRQKELAQQGVVPVVVPVPMPVVVAPTPKPVLTPRQQVCLDDLTTKLPLIEEDLKLAQGSACSNEDLSVQWPCDCEATPWPSSLKKIRELEQEQVAQR